MHILIHLVLPICFSNYGVVTNHLNHDKKQSNTCCPHYRTNKSIKSLRRIRLAINIDSTVLIVYKTC